MDLLCKSMDWFLYDRDLLHERVKIYTRLNIMVNHASATAFSRPHHDKNLIDPKRLAKLPSHLSYWVNLFTNIFDIFGKFGFTKHLQKFIP